jgi:hypothetical protein
VAISTERMLVREVKCFLCGYTLGEVLMNAVHQVFRRAPTCPPPPDGRLSRLRCPRCGGAVYLEGAETSSAWTAIPARAAAALRN